MEVETENYTGTANAQSGHGAHHLTISDAIGELKRRAEEIKKSRGDKAYYTVENAQSGIRAYIAGTQRDEMKNTFRRSKTRAYVYSAALVNIDRLFENARLALSHDDRYNVNEGGGKAEGDIVQMHRFLVVMKYEGNDYAVKITVKEYRNGNNAVYALQTMTVDAAEKMPRRRPPPGLVCRPPP